MSRTLAFYISRLFLAQFVVALAGLVGLAIVFDLLATAEDVLQIANGRTSALGYYILLRIPPLAAFLLPFAALLAGLGTFGRLARENEIVAMKAAGAPFTRLPLMLLPALLLVSGLHWVLNEHATPPAVRAYAAWTIDAETRRAERSGRPLEPGIWLRAEGSVIGVGAIQDDGALLRDLYLYERDADGGLTARTFAREAVYEDDEWVLSRGVRAEIEPGGSRDPEVFETRGWRTDLTPNELVNLALPTSTLPISALRDLLGRPDLGYRPGYVYATYLNHALAAPLAPLLMALLAAPAAQLLRRRGGLALQAAAAFALGFVYFLADGLLVALGEAGILPPLLAGWAAIIGFGCLAGTGLLYADR